MKVLFKNNYRTTVWVAVMFYDPDGCREYGNWGTRGWWRVEPGAEVWAFSTTNQYACFYAEAADGAHWSGGYGPVYVYYGAFSSCINIGSTAAKDIVGMRLITLPWLRWNPLATHTVNINP